MIEFLYVVEFDSGVVKVGRGQKAEIRIKSAECIGAIAGWVKTNEFSILCLGRARKAEAELIAFAASISSERRAKEWFVGADFIRLTNAASEFASKDYGDDYFGKKQDFFDCFKRWVAGGGASKERVDQEKLNRCIQMAGELHEIVSDFGGVTLLDDDYGFNGYGVGYKAAYALYFYLTDDIDALHQCRKNDVQGQINMDAVLTHFYWLVGDKGFLGAPAFSDAWLELKSHIDAGQLEGEQA